MRRVSLSRYEFSSGGRLLNLQGPCWLEATGDAFLPIFARRVCLPESLVPER